MPLDLPNHPWFEPWTDPHTGVVSYILTQRFAHFQKVLYYTTPGLSRDGRFLWFYGTFPPSRQWFLGAADLDPDSLRITWFPRPMNGNPRLTPEGDAAWVGIHGGIYRQPFDGEPALVARLPDDLIANRHLFSLATTLTVSADGRHIVLDSHIGNRWLISLADLHTGEIKPRRWFHHCHHHAMFSPVDPDLILIGQGPWHDAYTGEKGNIDIRMWLMDTKGQRYEPVQPDLWFNHNAMSCHEWWTPDGLVAWCDYEQGVYETDIRKPFLERTRGLVWPRPLIHAHCNADRSLFTGDYHPYRWSDEEPCGVYFFDRASGQDIAIASALPLPPIEPRDRRAYHFDPHPHFSPDDQFILYTTTVRGTLDVALAPVEPILDRLRRFAPHPSTR